jgi:Ala-tRNA(Pro) deacylase
MTVLPADHRIDLEKLDQITAKTSSLENEENFKSLFPDCAPGTMPPFGKLYGLPTYMDRSLSQLDYIVFEAGTHTDAIKLSYRDYERIAEPSVEDFAFKIQPTKPATS